MARPNVFGDDEDATEREDVTPASAPEPAKKRAPIKGETEMFRTSLYLSRAVHDVLREIAFHERKKVHDLFMEGLDLVLEKRRHPSTAEIVRSTKTS